MACAIPKAGGAFDYANKAFGKNIGFLTGMAQNIEFILAPPAISFAIGAYLNTFFNSGSFNLDADKQNGLQRICTDTRNKTKTKKGEKY